MRLGDLDALYNIENINAPIYGEGDFFDGVDAERLRWFDVIANAPAIDPVKHGRWIEDDDGDGRHCSVCGVDYCDLVTYPENFNFCPMCGAKMDADKTEAAT